MTPRKPVSTDPITWRGIEDMVTNAINAHDQNIILPRQEKQHSQNTSRLDKLESKVEAVEDLLTEAKGSWRIVKWLLIYISGGVSVLLTDFIVWLIRNHGHW